MALVAVAAAAVIAVAVPAASAHPLGNFTTNRFTALEIIPGEARINYVVDFAELAAFEEKALMDGDGGGISASERDEYARGMADRLSEGFSVRFNDSALSPRLIGARASFRPGQGGLETLRVEIDYAVALPENSGTLSYVDYNYSSRLGWKEVVASAGKGLRIVESSVPEQSISDELRSYPRDLLDDPLEVSTARVQFGPGVGSGEGSASAPASDGREEEDGSDDLLGDVFTSLIEPERSTPFMIAVALAVLLGAVHALGPGHGKLLLAAYLVGSEAKPRHAVRVGLAVSLMHTLSVVVVGLLILWGTRLFRPEDVYPWLGVVSGVGVLSLGIFMTARRLKERSRLGAGEGVPHSGHEHGHDRGHPSALGLSAIAMGGGLLPSPSALVVLLGAVALNRTAAGVVLVVAFGVGLAVMLTGLGLLVLKTKSVMARRPRKASLLPLLSALAICALGLYLTVRAAMTF